MLLLCHGKCAWRIMGRERAGSNRGEFVVVKNVDFYLVGQ